MGTTFIKPTFFGEGGRTVGAPSSVFLPPYLDWMPIELKAFWFVTRGHGDPRAKHALLQSQGEQLLVELTTPLQDHKFSALQEIDNGLEERCDEFARERGISRTPRNQ